MEFRIGDRDPTTGLYYVIWPDGSQMLNGIKAFNSEHQSGEVVRATRRSDGMWILDSSKAIDRSGGASSNPIAQSSIGNVSGSLLGQVFNTEDEPGTDLITIKSVPYGWFDPGGLSTFLGRGSWTERFVSNTSRDLFELNPETNLLETFVTGDLTHVGTLTPVLDALQYDAPYYHFTYENIPSFSMGGITYPARRNEYIHVSYATLNKIFQLGYQYLVIAGHVVNQIGSVGIPSGYDGRGTVSIQLGRAANVRDIDDPLFPSFELLTLDGAGVSPPYDIRARKRLGHVDLRWLVESHVRLTPPYPAARTYSYVWAVQIETGNPRNVKFLEPVITPNNPITDTRTQIIKF
jgi:hypothetical protein